MGLADRGVGLADKRVVLGAALGAEQREGVLDVVGAEADDAGGRLLRRLGARTLATAAVWLSKLAQLADISQSVDFINGIKSSTQNQKITLISEKKWL